MAIFPRMSDHTGQEETKETPPAAAEQEGTQKPEAETPEAETPEVPAAEEASQNNDEEATEEVAGGADLGEETEERETEPESERQEPPSPEDETETPEAETKEAPGMTDFQKEIESKIYQESGGKMKTFDELQAYTKELGRQYNELAQKKPEITAETFQEIDKKLQQEKGYSLAEALEWKNKDVKSMSSSDKLLWSMKAEDQVGHTDAWYQEKLSKFEILDKPEAEIKEMIEDGDLSEKEVRSLRVERDDMLHRADKILEKYKGTFDLNVNFDAKPSAEADQERQLAEEQKAAEVRAAISESLKGLDRVEFEVDLPSELGKHKIAIPVSEAAKRDLLDTEDRFFLSKRYTGEDGKFDFQKLHRNEFIARNISDIIQKAAIQSSAEAEKRRLAKKDNVHTEKERRAATADGKSPFAEAANRLSEKFGRR